MKYSTVIIIIAAFLIIVNCAFAGPAFQPVGDVEFNFGTVNQGQIVKHKFTFKNVGDEVLKIMSVKGS